MEGMSGKQRMRVAAPVYVPKTSVQGRGGVCEKRCLLPSSPARCAVHQASEREDGAEKFEAYARRAALLAEADELRAKVCGSAGEGGAGETAEGRAGRG